MRRYLLFVAVALTFISCEWGGPDIYTTGTVTLIDLDGNAVRQPVRVTLFDHSDSVSLDVNKDGVFNFTEESAGDYWVEGSKPGYTSAGTSVHYGDKDYPIENVHLALYEIPTSAPLMDSVGQDSMMLYLRATYKPRRGEALAFVYHDPSPDSSLHLIAPGRYSMMHETWEYHAVTRKYRGKFVGSVLYNYACDSARERYSLLSDGPVSNLIFVP